MNTPLIRGWSIDLGDEISLPDLSLTPTTPIPTTAFPNDPPSEQKKDEEVSSQPKARGVRQVQEALKAADKKAATHPMPTGRPPSLLTQKPTSNLVKLHLTSMNLTNKIVPLPHPKSQSPIHKTNEIKSKATVKDNRLLKSSPGKVYPPAFIHLRSDLEESLKRGKVSEPEDSFPFACVSYDYNTLRRIKTATATATALPVPSKSESAGDLSRTIYTPTSEEDESNLKLQRSIRGGAGKAITRSALTSASTSRESSSLKGIIQNQSQSQSLEGGSRTIQDLQIANIQSLHRFRAGASRGKNVGEYFGVIRDSHYVNGGSDADVGVDVDVGADVNAEFGLAKECVTQQPVDSEQESKIAIEDGSNVDVVQQPYKQQLHIHLNVNERKSKNKQHSSKLSLNADEVYNGSHLSPRGWNANDGADFDADAISTKGNNNQEEDEMDFSLSTSTLKKNDSKPSTPADVSALRLNSGKERSRGRSIPCEHTSCRTKFGSIQESTIWDSNSDVAYCLFCWETVIGHRPSGAVVDFDRDILKSAGVDAREREREKDGYVARVKDQGDRRLSSSNVEKYVMHDPKKNKKKGEASSGGDFEGLGLGSILVQVPVPVTLLDTEIDDISNNKAKHHPVKPKAQERPPPPLLPSQQRMYNSAALHKPDMLETFNEKYQIHRRTMFDDIALSEIEVIEKSIIADDVKREKVKKVFLSSIGSRSGDNRQQPEDEDNNNNNGNNNKVDQSQSQLLSTSQKLVKLAQLQSSNHENLSLLHRVSLSRSRSRSASNSNSGFNGVPSGASLISPLHHHHHHHTATDTDTKTGINLDIYDGDNGGNAVISEALDSTYKRPFTSPSSSSLLKSVDSKSVDYRVYRGLALTLPLTGLGLGLGLVASDDHIPPSNEEEERESRIGLLKLKLKGNEVNLKGRDEDSRVSKEEYSRRRSVEMRRVEKIERSVKKAKDERDLVNSGAAAAAAAGGWSRPNSRTSGSRPATSQQNKMKQKQRPMILNVTSQNAAGLKPGGGAVGQPFGETSSIPFRKLIGVDVCLPGKDEDRLYYTDNNNNDDSDRDGMVDGSSSSNAKKKRREKIFRVVGGVTIYYKDEEATLSVDERRRLKSRQKIEGGGLVDL